MYISLDYIIKHLNKPWDWKIISERKDITLNFIDQYSYKDLNWKALLKNITIEFIDKYPLKSWYCVETIEIKKINMKKKILKCVKDYNEKKLKKKAKELNTEDEKPPPKGYRAPAIGKLSLEK